MQACALTLLEGGGRRARKGCCSPHFASAAPFDSKFCCVMMTMTTKRVTMTKHRFGPEDQRFLNRFHCIVSY